MKAFQQAVDLKVPNLDLLAKTYNQMGTLFMYQGLHDEVIRVNRKAIELYLLQGKRNKISYFQRDIARMYDIKEEKDSALYYYKEACHTALMDGDSARYYGIWGELGGFYYKTGNIDEAKQILKKTEFSTYIRNKSHIYFVLGDIYNHLGLQDSVYHYHTKTLLNNDIRNEYYSHISLYRIEQEKKNYVQALKHIDKALVLKDSIDATTQTEAIAQINALYNYQHIERENNLLALEKEKQKSQMMILLMALMGSASCCIIYFYRQKEKKQKELDVEKLLRYIAEDNYESSQKTISQKKAEIKNLNIQLKEAQENNPPLKEKELRLMNLQTSSIYKEFKQAANDESVNLISVKNQNKWKELEEAINKAYPNFTKQLNLVCPNLSEKEMQVCLLTKLKIQPSGIAIILKCNRQSITNIRTRIHKKIQLEGKEYSKINHFIDEI